MNKDIMTVSIHEDRDRRCVKRNLEVFLPDGSAREVFFEFAGDVLPMPLDLCDFAALATAFYAMRAGLPLHIHGRVSRTLLRNLEEFQEAWAIWVPDEYHRVPITADDEVDDAASSERTGIFALSGGVDATFTLLRHYLALAGRRTCTPVASLLVHGFDIPLEETAAFEVAKGSVANVTSKLDLPLVTCRTNWKSVLCKHWGFEYATALVACLHQFAGLANIGVFGAAEDYAHLALPWGSNPATNPLLSGGRFEVFTEGTGLSRTDRLSLICKRPDIAASLRVCWEGPVTGRNCGRCEKCLRTKMNFLAVGEAPRCFDESVGIAQIVGIKARNPIQIAYLTEILDTARQQRITDSWVAALSVAIARNRAMLPLRPAEKWLRKQIKETLARLS